MDKEFSDSDISFRSGSGARNWKGIESKSNQNGCCKSRPLSEGGDADVVENRTILFGQSHAFSSQERRFACQTSVWLEQRIGIKGIAQEPIL